MTETSKVRSLPTEFLTSIGRLLGDEAALLQKALSGNAPVSFRINPFKWGRNPLVADVALERVPWSQWGFYVDERPAFTFDPLFHAGYYYVQEASSMFVEHVVRQLVKEPAVCLDVCAAPGGKSLSLLSALPEGSLLVSNEVVRPRAHVLAETLAKLGDANVAVTNNTAKDFSALRGWFDVVLVDAPCSGEGMFRKDETAVTEWSPRNVEMCAARQRDILADIWPALKPGGLLVYSTCTYNTEENEENALWIAQELGAEFEAVKTEEEWGIASSLDPRVVAYRFFPHSTKGEGLFVAVLRKAGADDAEAAPVGSRAKGNARSKKKAPLFLKDISPYADLLSAPHDFEFMDIDNRVVALPSLHSETMAALGERLRIVSMGIEMGVKKGRDFIPSQALALSRHGGGFNRYGVTYEEAIRYLRREAVPLADAPAGYVVLTYKGEPLGFVKNLGNRSNNLYPSEWRIRSGYLPEKRTGIFGGTDR